MALSFYSSLYSGLELTKNIYGTLTVVKYRARTFCFLRGSKRYLSLSPAGDTITYGVDNQRGLLRSAVQKNVSWLCCAQRLLAAPNC